MKIIQLRFKNLNSLAGEWIIDFTGPEYVTDGIFAISGPTGAGKSSILDAICLALYGRTPRLKNISKTTNEIMSRQTGICFAEVTFETHEGRFQAFWSQRRARDKADGALQNPQHEISNAETKQVIASQLTTTGKEIEKRTGMDYERFVQSMMLAQGGFAAFLQAKGDDRAPILEQITGTKIYSDISIHVHHQHGFEKAKLDQLKAENKGIILLSADEEEQLSAAVAEKNLNKVLLLEETERLDAALKWIKTIRDYRNDLIQISQEEAALAKDIQEFDPRQKKLLNALKAATIDGEFASLKAARDQQKEDLDLLATLQIGAPALELAKTEAQTVYDTAEKLLMTVKAEKDSLLKITSQIKLIDQEIAQKKTASEKIESQIKSLKREWEDAILKKADITRSIDGFKTESVAIESYQAENKADESLIVEFTGISSTVARLLDSHSLMSAADENLKASGKALADKSEEVNNIERELTIIIQANKSDLNNLAQAKDKLATLLNGKSPEELLRRKDDLILHLADLRKIEDYATERTLLKDGNPCPLCGSVHHPFAEGNVPSVNEAEQELAGLIALLQAYGAINQQITDLSNTEKNSGVKVIQQNNLWNTARQQKLSLDNELARLARELTASRANFDQISVSLKKLLRPFGIDEIPADEKKISHMLAILEVRRDKWQKQNKRKAEISADITAKLAEAGKCDVIIETKEKDITLKEKESAELGASFRILTDNRTELFGNKAPDNEEALAAKKVSQAEISRNNALELLQKKNQLLETGRTRIFDLTNKTQDKKSVLEESEKQFIQLLNGKGFENEAAFRSVRLDQAEREILEKESGTLDTRKTQLGTRRKEKEESLAREEIKNLTAEPEDALKVLHEESKNGLELLLQEIGALIQKLETNIKAKDIGEMIQRKIDSQKGVYERWARLNDLIGSHDGKKYRNFAQGLTLEIMVSYANSQLVKLSDRYLLIRDRYEPLELNVIDNYQAGEIRSTKNLSGGESFIVSLALALGLSRMSSKNVRVDSLFLDEGFGTLDEDTLETALGTLASLRQDGKMIGVISHVGAMKERINTKIIVQPLREGRSVLSGPGCTAIN